MCPDIINRYLSNILTVDQIEALRNKTIDGSLNMIRNVPSSAIAKIDDKTKLHDEIVYKDVPNQSILQHDDVNFQGLQDGDRITYDAASQKWVNSQPTVGGGDVTNAASVGEEGANVFYAKEDTVLQFSKIKSLDPSLSIANNGNLVEVDIADASTTVKGIVQLATSNESEATKACNAADTRLSNTRTPSLHALSHKAAQPDVIKLDELGPPDDNTTLDASTTKHGLMQKYPNNTNTFLRGDGTFASVVMAGGIRIYDRSFSDVDVVSTSTKQPIYTLTVLANDLGTNGILEVEVYLTYLNNTGSSKDLEIWIEFGGVIQYQCTTPTITDDSTERAALLHIRLINKNNAAIQNIWGHFVMSDATNPTVGIGNIDNDAVQTNSPIGQTSTSNINTALNQNLVVSVKHSASDPDLRVRKRAVIAKMS